MEIVRGRSILTAGLSLIVYQLVYNPALCNDQIKMSLVFIVWSLTEQVNMLIVTLGLDTFFLAEKVTAWHVF